MHKVRILAAILACCGSGAAASVSLEIAPKNTCTEIHLPRWDWKDRKQPPKATFGPGHCNLEFRVAGANLLVVGSCDFYNGARRRLEGQYKFSFSLPAGEVQKASSDDWEHARPMAKAPDRLLPPGSPRLNELPSPGSKPYAGGAGSGKVSKDARFDALFSWDGTDTGGQPSR